MAGAAPQSEAAATAAPARPALARLALLPAALLLLALLAGAPGAAAQQLADGQVQQVQQQCPVSLRYAVTLGQPPANGSSTPQVPIFVAVLTLQNNENVSWGQVVKVASWRPRGRGTRAGRSSAAATARSRRSRRASRAAPGGCKAL